MTYTVAANTGAARRGTIVVGGQTFEIDQEAATACVFAVSPTSLNIGASGGPGGPLSVSTTNSCSWTSVSNAPWIVGHSRKREDRERHRQHQRGAQHGDGSFGIGHVSRARP